MTNDRSWFPLTGPIARLDKDLTVLSRKPIAVDPLTGPRLALAGQVVTMDDRSTVMPDAVVYVDKGRIVSVQNRGEPAPAGFEGTPVIDTAGTIFPGLIELHNHLSYNALPLWSPVPKRFDHRGQWPNHKDYRPLVSGPMTILGQYRDKRGKAALLPALVRYVECKCLLGGVTTTQGVKLASNAGVQRFYRGIVRNVEQTDDPDLPEAQGRIPDVAARDARRFLAHLQKEDSCFLLHLSEGIADPDKPLSVARKHFLALEVAPGHWALAKTFTGIHAAGMLPEDFEILARHGGSMVWSPLSNLLLYGNTARVAAARQAGVTIGLGSDWSPTGSKNLLGELKVAWLYSQEALGGLLSARDIIAMATRDAARILKWDKELGSVASGRRADFLVIEGKAADPYDALMHASEADICLVTINGIARYGAPELMKKLGPRDQTVRVGGKTRWLYLKQESGDPAVGQVSLAKAASTLRGALRDLVKLARATEKAQREIAPTRALDAPVEPVWSLALDELCDCGTELAPRLPFNGPRDFTGPDRGPRITRAAALLSTVVKPVELDPVTVADDANFLEKIAQQPNVPEAIRLGLAALY